MKAIWERRLIRKRMHMAEVEIQLNHQSKITENVVVRLIINSSHESTMCRREITLPVIISLLENSLNPQQYHFFQWKIWMGMSRNQLERGSHIQESSMWAQRRKDPTADANAMFSLIGLCTYCACASQAQLIAHYYSPGFLFSHSASPTLQFKAPYFNFMTGQSVAKSLLLSASVILAHHILASPELSCPLTACASSFTLHSQIPSLNSFSPFSPPASIFTEKQTHCPWLHMQLGSDVSGDWDFKDWRNHEPCGGEEGDQ